MTYMSIVELSLLMLSSIEASHPYYFAVC